MLWVLGSLTVLPAQLVFAAAAVLCVVALIAPYGFTWGALPLVPLALSAVAMLTAMTLELATVQRVLWWRYRMRRSEVALAQHGGRSVRVRSLDVRLRFTRFGVEVDDRHYAVELSPSRARGFAPVPERWARPLSVPPPRSSRSIIRLWIGGVALFVLWVLGAGVVALVRALVGF